MGGYLEFTQINMAVKSLSLVCVNDVLWFAHDNFNTRLQQYWSHFTHIIDHGTFDSSP